MTNIIFQLNLQYNNFIPIKTNNIKYVQYLNRWFDKSTTPEEFSSLVKYDKEMESEKPRSYVIYKMIH